MADPAEIINKAANAKFVSTCDLNRAFWQVKLDPNSRKYCAFKTHIGLMEWVSMPMGCKTAPRTCQRLIDRLLRGAHAYTLQCYNTLHALQDDITIFSNSFADHLVHLREVLSRLLQSGLTLSPRKCQFALQKLCVLGHVIDVEHGQILATDDKIEAIKNFSRPITKSQLRAWLGLTGYYREMLCNYAETNHCLTQLLRKNMPDKLAWKDIHEQAFQKLKTSMISSPFLAARDPTKDYILECDATQYTVAGILSQLDDQGHERVVAYASRNLLPRESRYPTIERELVAICWCLEHWDQYIYGRHVQVYCDHRPLSFLQSVAQHSSRLAKWVVQLQKYDITTTNRRGVDNSNADGLSRLMAPPSETDGNAGL